MVIKENTPQPISATQLTEATISGLMRDNSLITNSLFRSYLHELDNATRFNSIRLLLDQNQPLLPSSSSKPFRVEASIREKDFSSALQEIDELEQENEELVFCDLQKTLINMEAMPDKMMSIKTDMLLKKIR